MDYHELYKKKVTDLREMAKEHTDLPAAATALNKDQLVDFLCEKLGIEKPHKVAIGVNKTSIKGEIKELKKVRDEALSAQDHDKLKDTRRKMHRLKRKLHRATKIAG
jgi:superfamily II DNA helicase RecQ